MRTYALPSVILMLVLCGGVVAQKDDNKADKEAKRARDAAWTKTEEVLKNPKAQLADAIAAVESLRGQIDHDIALKLLDYFVACDNAWSSNAKDKLGRVQLGPRPVESYKVAKAILKEIRAMRNAEEVLKFQAELEAKETYSLRTRTAMLDAVAGNWDDTRCAGLILTYAKDATRDGDMRVLAIDHLASHARTPEVLEALLVSLRDRSWRIRDASIVALIQAAEGNKDKVTIALINALANEQGKLRKNLGDALERINNVKLGTDPDAWTEWFRNKNRDAQGLPPRSDNPGRGTRSKVVFDTEVFSDRYVFVVDSSVSMLKKVTEEEKEELRRSVTGAPGEQKDPRRPLDWTKINTKLDLAREEIIRSLEVMDPKLTKFTIIKFSNTADTWKEELVPTDTKNVTEAADWLRAIKGGDQTNVYGALNSALDLSEKLAGIDIDERKGKPKEKGKDDKVITGPHRDEALPDTLFLYSDGFATAGKYRGGSPREWAGKSAAEKGKLYEEIMKYMLEELQDRNRVSRITIHTVGVGNPQDFTTMGALARRCGGKYTAIGRK